MRPTGTSEMEPHRPHPEEPCAARRLEGWPHTLRLLAVLRDARIDIGCCRYRHHWNAEVGQARLRCALLRTRVDRRYDMIRTSETVISSHCHAPLSRRESGASSNPCATGETMVCPKRRRWSISAGALAHFL